MKDYQRYVNQVADFLLKNSDYDEKYSARPIIPSVEVVQNSPDIFFCGRWNEEEYKIILNEGKRFLHTRLVLSHEMGHWFFGENEIEFLLDLNINSLFDNFLMELYGNAVSFIMCKDYKFFESNYNSLLHPDNRSYENPKSLLIESISELESSVEKYSIFKNKTRAKKKVVLALDCIDSAIQVYAVSIAKGFFETLMEEQFCLEPLVSRIKKHPLARELRREDTSYVQNCLLTYANDIVLSKFAYSD